MKNLSPFIAIVALAFSMSAMAQSGINTATPAATLDVTARNATGTTTNVEGLLVPRVDRQRAQSMAAVPTSTLIYVNNAATGTATGTAANIDATGYYFFNGTVWTKLTPAANNLYNVDGTLTANRTVAQNANTLAFTGTAVNSFSVNGATFSVDAANNRVGIGTTAPLTSAHVANTGTGGNAVTATNVTNMALRLENTGNGQAVIQHFLARNTGNATRQVVMGLNPNINTNGVFYLGTDGTNAPSLQMDLVNGNFAIGGLPNATQKLAVNGNLSTSGNMGIGTNAANAPLQFGNGEANRKIVLYEGTNNDHQFYGLGLNSNLLRYQVSNNAGSHAFFAGASANASTELMRITGAGNVGIGTTTPNAPLQFSNDEVSRKIVLWELANNNHQFYGLGVNTNTLRYQIDVPSSSHVFFVGSGASTSTELMRITGTGNVGIGTATPSQRLHVMGNVLVSGTVTQNSDIRLKKDVENNGYGLKELLSLRTINYRYKDEALGTDKKVGFIAQEVKKAMPELVTTANDDMKTLSVNYAEMTVVLTKAVQELQQQLKKQQEEIAELKAQSKAKP